MKNIYKYFTGIALFAFAFMLMPQTVLADEDQKATPVTFVVLESVPAPAAEPATLAAAPVEIQCPPGFIAVNFELACVAQKACTPFEELGGDGTDLMKKWHRLNYEICGIPIPPEYL